MAPPRPVHAFRPAVMSRSGGLIATWAISALLLASSASAVTVRDVIELSQAGVSDDVLVELVVLEPPVPRITPADLLALREAGVSDRVVVEMIRAVRAVSERRERAAADEEARARARQELIEIVTDAKALAAADARTTTGGAEQALRSDHVVVPVPVPVVVHTVVPVGSTRLTRGSAVAHGRDLPRAAQSGAPVNATAIGSARASDRGGQRPHWIVNSTGWIIR